MQKYNIYLEHPKVLTLLEVIIPYLWLRLQNVTNKELVKHYFKKTKITKRADTSWEVTALIYFA